jgi:hypothetical protein
LPSPRRVKIDACPWRARSNRLVAGFIAWSRLGGVIRAGIVRLFPKKPFFQFPPIFLGLYHGLVIVVVHHHLCSKSPTIQAAGIKKMVLEHIIAFRNRLTGKPAVRQRLQTMRNRRRLPEPGLLFGNGVPI